MIALSETLENEPIDEVELIVAFIEISAKEEIPELGGGKLISLKTYQMQKFFIMKIYLL